MKAHIFLLACAPTGFISIDASCNPLVLPSLNITKAAEIAILSTNTQAGKEYTRKRLAEMTTTSSPSDNLYARGKTTETNIRNYQSFKANAQKSNNRQLMYTTIGIIGMPVSIATTALPTRTRAAGFALALAVKGYSYRYYPGFNTGVINEAIQQEEATLEKLRDERAHVE